VIYIDTGAFLARYLGSDQYHEKSLKFWNDLSNFNENCFTSNFVLDETLTLLARRAGYNFAAERAHILYSSKALTILRPTHEDEIAAIELFEKYADQEVSFTDCVSFVLMKKRKITRVFTFDEHFQLAGFKLYP
jgi:predicted nucleic acid-binding protein